MTVALVANIARPISSAISTAFAMDNYGKLNDYGKLGAWSPLSLFANSEVGAWYDPSDLTTMFQDRAGTTPVTADGQTVGFILDKSKGLAFGSELITNGDFSNGTTGWTSALLTATVSVVSGELEVNVTSAWGYCRRSITGLTVGKTYKISGNFRAGSVTTARVQKATSVGVSTTSKSSVPFTWYWLADATFFTMELDTSGEVGTAYFDNISFKEISGNHATAPSDAARPLYKTDGTYHWLQFDGVDDSLSTAAINFTATDEISLFYGATRNNNATSALIESSSTFNSNNGSFVLISGTDGSTVDGYTFKTRGDINTTLGARVSNLTSPNKSIVSCSGNISADLTTMRVNSVSGTNGTQDQGIGNLGNYSFYICSRGGSSLFFNGNIYSLIVRGALSTTDEITNTETWVNQRTGAY